MRTARANEWERGVARDHAQAAQWFQRAANQGYAAAQFQLGNMYYGGELTKDDVEAYKWYSLAVINFPAALAAERASGVQARDFVANKLTKEQLADGQRRAREWTPR